MSLQTPFYAGGATALDLRHEQMAAIPSAFGVETGEGLSHQALLLMSRLQTSLDPEELIHLFTQSVKEELPHDGFFYENAAEGVQTGQGVRVGDQCGYELRMGNQLLGELTLYRRRPFRPHECEQLDALVWCLVYPLRNALMYRRALRTAFRDPLTGAHNRGAFDDAVVHEVEVSRRTELPLALIIIDIDHFKAINDNFGHAIGDCALQSLVEAADDSTRGADVIYRYGGEEFVVLLNNTDLKGAQRLAERIRREVERRDHSCRETTLKMTASFGVAELAAGESAVDLFRRADAALYRAKNGGRNRVESA